MVEMYLYPLTSASRNTEAVGRWGFEMTGFKGHQQDLNPPPSECVVF